MLQEVRQALIDTNWVNTFELDGVLDKLGLDYETYYTNQTVRNTIDTACEDLWAEYCA